ncbi:MAG TPA: L-2-hydroxyglutarate oxidase [Conexibacter sp.]|jgi:L-2-hydroxyglutarate oxidase LhgO
MHVVIVGGGILGLATARLLAREQPGCEVTLLEKETALALHQTGHNSGVVHAGLYYEPGSLKARLCRRGMTLLHAFCEERGLAYDECGKLVVATDERELERFDKLEARAIANEVPGLRRLGPAELREIEPHATGIAALHSPHTAIVDYGAIARAFGEDAVAHGATIRTGARVTRIEIEAGSGAGGVGGRAGGVGGCAGVRVGLADGSTVAADRAIVCAGLHADRLARASGQPAEPRIIPFRGEYWRLRPERSDLVRGMIYPVPDPALPFLGVHLTRKVDGTVWVGPNAVLATALEGYRRSSFSARELGETLGWPGTPRLMRRYWRVGATELVRSNVKAVFMRDARRYVPELRTGDAIPAPAGVRAQALDRDGALVDDFRLGLTGPITWVRNAPSPAATSSLAIAEELVERAGIRLGASSPAPPARPAA